jgi:hypothetical protein
VILKLINDKKYHINIKKIINENKNKLYEDSYVISELEDFFIREYKKKNS